MKNSRRKLTHKRTDGVTLTKMALAMTSGKQKAFHQNGNIDQKIACRGKLPYMGGGTRPLKAKGAYLISTSKRRYQEDPYTGALVRA